MKPKSKCTLCLQLRARLRHPACSEFLLLDEVVKEGRNIDLVERPEDVLSSTALTAGLQQHGAVHSARTLLLHTNHHRTPLADRWHRPHFNTSCHAGLAGAHTPCAHVVLPL